MTIFTPDPSEIGSIPGWYGSFYGGSTAHGKRERTEGRDGRANFSRNAAPFESLGHGSNTPRPRSHQLETCSGWGARFLGAVRFSRGLLRAASPARSARHAASPSCSV